MRQMSKQHTPRALRAERAAWTVASVLAALLLVNTYWSFGGQRGLSWVMGCDCEVPLFLVWMQEAALAIGITVVLARAGVWPAPMPWIWKIGTWTMAAAFGAVGLQNLVGDNTLQARLVFAPLALLLCGLCVVVARRPATTGP
jgi:hypothetical protein